MSSHCVRSSLNKSCLNVCPEDKLCKGCVEDLARSLLELSVSSPICIRILTKGNRCGQECGKKATCENMCTRCYITVCHKKAKSSRNSKEPVEQCKRIFTRGPRMGKQCEKKGKYDGFCLLCKNKSRVYSGVEQCSYVKTKGPRMGERCPKKAIENGFCYYCRNKKSVFEAKAESQ